MLCYVMDSYYCYTTVRRKVKSTQVAFNKKKQWQSHCMYTMSKRYTNDGKLQPEE